MSKKENIGIREAIKALGSQEALANALDVQQPMISKYLYGNCPGERAVQIERITGVKREKIRPDLYLRATKESKC